ncbi:uncharacterized protein LOC134811349 isoform X2 [Bolinopsis microptera]|uniref:uncharacterized protein LOC134811349 isoform X2 n=1 Tax=Bolinopsis microptera TaxID=2820187 RepID=UPI003078BA41
MSIKSSGSVKLASPGSFILKADIEGQLSCTVSARDGLSIKDVLWEKLENTGGRMWENFLVFTKWTRIHIEWEMNVSCVRGHALQIVNKLDILPIALPGAHHFMRKDVIHTAAAPYCEKDFYYMIRPSGSAKNTGSFALVITTPSFPNGRSCLRHVTIGFDRETNKFLLCSKEFDSLDLLVAFFKTTPIKAHNGPNMYLRYPVPVDAQLDEECKQSWRTTRTGKQSDHPDIDTISLWSYSSSLTVNSINTPMSYDYDGSVSGLSEDEQNYDVPNHFYRKDKTRGSTMLSREESVMSPMSDGSHSHIYSSDVEMRAQSGSSSGGSFSSTSKASYNNTPRSLNTRSQFFFPVTREVKSEIEKERPRSEILREDSSDSQRENLRASSMPPFTSLSINRSISEKSLSDVEKSKKDAPEELYVEMSPSVPPTPSNPARFTHPEPLAVETLKRHPMYQSRSGSDQDSDPKTLTRVEEPESCYMNISIANKSASSSNQDEPVETYVDMSTLRPLKPPPQDLLLSLQSQSHHDYVNRQGIQNGFSPSSSGSEYQHFDPVTSQKLIDNVQSLMATVKEQAKEILNLKMSVKDLKIKVETLEQLNIEEFEYDQ